MSKKVSSVDPLSLLREYISNNKPIKQADENLYFGQTKLPINTPTGFLKGFEAFLMLSL